MIASIAKIRLDAEKTKSELSGLLRMAACEFSPEQVAEIDALWQSGEFDRARVAELREANLRPIQPTAQETQIVLESMQLVPAPSKPRRPEYLPLMCLQREFFKDTVLRIDTPVGTTFLKMVHALQSPYLAVFISLDKQTVVLPEFDPGNYHERVLDVWQHEFSAAKWPFVFMTNGGLDATWPLPCV